MKTDVLPTDRTYFVVTIARDVATFKGCQMVQPMHLLQGLLLERDGMAGRILSDAGIQASNELREDIPYPHHASGIEYEQWRKRGIREVSLLTDGAKLVFERAAQEGREFYHMQHGTYDGSYIGTEHLLLALLSFPETSAYQYLQTKLNERGLQPNHLRERTFGLFGVSGRE